MKVSKGSLILTRGIFEFDKNEFSISVVLDNDIGNEKCYIRNILRLENGQLHKTMNWTSQKINDIISVICNISDIDYTQDFFDISDRLPLISLSMEEHIPQYLI